MYQPIKILQHVIGPDAVNSCRGRDLHNLLEVQTVYTTWFYRRIEEYGFIEGQDFLLTLEESPEVNPEVNPEGRPEVNPEGRPEVNHIITLGMAKE